MDHSRSSGKWERISGPSTLPKTPRTGFKRFNWLSTSGVPTSPACQISSQSRKLVINVSSRNPCVSESKPIRMNTSQTQREGEFVSGCHQCATVRRIESAVPAVGCDDEIGFGPHAMERPCALHGADDVVAALHDHPGDMTDARGVAQQLV